MDNALRNSATLASYIPVGIVTVNYLHFFTIKSLQATSSNVIISLMIMWHIKYIFTYKRLALNNLLAKANFISTNRILEVN